MDKVGKFNEVHSRKINNKVDAIACSLMVSISEAKKYQRFKDFYST
jgi:hypothetical protein